MNTTKHDTRPTTDRIHADRVACLAARDAREGERVMVWRPGFGWVDRPAMPEAESETECEGAA